MNKKQQSSNKRRKRASIGLAVCFAAAIVLTGTTEENYIDELYEEQQKVAGYKEYLRSVQESKDNLSSISKTLYLLIQIHMFSQRIRPFTHYLVEK